MNRLRTFTPAVGVVAVALALAVTVAASAGCDVVALGPPPAGVNACRPGQQFFIEQIWPNVLGKDYGGKHCYDSKCHDAGSGRQLILTPPTSTGTIPFPPDWQSVYTSAAEQMQCSNVRASELLTRGSNQRTHGGGKLFESSGPEATLLEMWVAAP